MKRKGRHPANALSAVKVRSLKQPGRHADGNGLYLVVDPSGAKRWLLRMVVHGRRRDIGLGGVRTVSLLEARDLAYKYRKIAREGGDPIKEMRSAKETAPTFRVAAATVHEAHSKAWRNKKHTAQWIATLEAYAHPFIGDLPVNKIDTPDILKLLAPIWLTLPETARRVKQRVSTVFDWCKAANYCAGENPVAGVSKGLPKQPDRKKHYAALPYDEVPAFVSTLRESNFDEATKLAFEFLILTAARTGEVLRAMDGEIDVEKAVWIVPSERMKAHVEHRVPLTDRALEIVVSARELHTVRGGFLFPGRAADRPLSNMTLLMARKRMGIDATVHGFRSAFKDWATERTNFPLEVSEAALAHVVRDKTEAAYRRGDLFEKRRPLMDRWADFATASSGEVIHLAAR